MTPGGFPACTPALGFRRSDSGLPGTLCPFPHHPLLCPTSPASTRTIARRFKERGEKFGPLTEKILLDAEDKKSRQRFAKKYSKKPRTFWTQTLDAVIDNKWFQIYHNGKRRGWIARRTCRGAYRKKGQKYDEGFIKPKAELRYNTGKKAACIMGAVGGGAQPGRQAGRQAASQPGRLTPGSLCSPRFVRVPCTKGGWAGGEGASPRRLGQRALSCRLRQHPATVAPT